MRVLKTTYYLRSLGATHMEKSTESAKGGKFGGVVGAYEGGDLLKGNGSDMGPEAPDACSILDPDCEACQ